MFDEVSVVELLRLMPGGSQSVLGLCDDGNLYVLKTSKNPQGPNVLANEYVGTEVMEALSLPIASWRIARPSSTMCVRCDLADSAHQTWDSATLYFASRFVESTNNTLAPFRNERFASRLTNREDFLGALVFDSWAGSTDAREVLYQYKRASLGVQAVFIDQGHAFGGPFWRFNGSTGAALCRDLRVYENIVRRDLIERWTTRLQEVVPSMLPGLLKHIPETWYQGDKSALLECLLKRLDLIDRYMTETLNFVDRRRT